RRHDFSAHVAGSTPRVFARSPVAGSPRFLRSGGRRRRSASTCLTHPLVNGDTTSPPTSPALRRECSRDHQSLDLRGSFEAASVDAAQHPPGSRIHSSTATRLLCPPRRLYAASVREITSRWISEVPSKSV